MMNKIQLQSRRCTSENYVYCSLLMQTMIERWSRVGIVLKGHSHAKKVENQLTREYKYGYSMLAKW